MCDRKHIRGQIIQLLHRGWVALPALGVSEQHGDDWRELLRTLANCCGAMVLGGAGKRLISNDDLRGSAGASPAYAPLLQFTPPTTPPPPTATCKFSMILRNKNIEAPLGGLMPIAAALRIAMIALGLVEQVLALVAVAKHLRKDS